MAERPLIFSGPMVRAILAGKKTQTRRLVKQCRQFEEWDSSPDGAYHAIDCDNPPGSAIFLVAGDHGYTDSVDCPHGAPGNLLWVKETVRWVPDVLWEPSANPSDSESVKVDYGHAEFVADDGPCVIDAWPWKLNPLPSVFLPRGASRISLLVTGVRVQRLQDISEADARAEGCSPVDDAVEPWKDTACTAFRLLWDSINGKRAPWSANPWVWAVSFEVQR